MQGSSLRSALIKIVLVILLIIVLAVIMFQLNNIEKRLIQMNTRMERLDETSGEFSSSIKKLEEALKDGNFGQGAVAPIEGKGGDKVAKSAVISTKRKYLHPKVKNFLKEDNFIVREKDAIVGGTLTRWYGPDPKSFNYLVSNDGELANYVAQYVFFEYFGDRSRINPDIWVSKLAERIEITDDYKEYTVYLKKGIKWHRPAVDWANPRYDWLKGDHFVTAKDVKFTIDIILNKQVECPSLRNYYLDVDYVKVIDDYTVVFRWKKKTYNSVSFTVSFMPIPEFIYGYDEDGKPFPKETIGLRFNDHWYNKKAIGCGPYEFVSYETGVGIKLRRFDDYYGQKPAIDNINYLIYPDQKQNLLKIKSKVQDFGILYPTDYREEILNGKPDSPFKNGSIKNDKYDEMVYTYLGWNNESPLFKDKRVRRAMTHAMNREFMLQNIFMGLGTIITGPFYIHSSSCDKSLKPYAYDLAKSRRYLSEAGWKDVDNDGILEKKVGQNMKKFEFDMLLGSGSPEWTAAANIYKEDLLKIGIKMNVRLVDWAVMMKKMEDRDFDAYGGAWGMPWEQDPYQIWHSSQASVPKSSNHISFRNKEADKIIEQLRNTFDMNKRIKLYHKFHKIIYNEQPYTFFFSRKRCAVWWCHLKRVIFSVLRPHSDSTPWYMDKKP